VREGKTLNEQHGKKAKDRDTSSPTGDKARGRVCKQHGKEANDKDPNSHSESKTEKEHMSNMAKEERIRTQTHFLKTRQRKTADEQHGKEEK
jgi:hypothetical protein